MLWRLARSSKKALPEKCQRCSEGREVKPLWEPTGTKPGGGVGGREGCVWSLEARQGLGGRGNGRGPRLCLDSGCAPGPASRRRLTSLRFEPPGRRAELAADGAGPPRWGLWISLAAPPAAASALGFCSAPWDLFPPGPSLRTRRPASHPPLPAPGAGRGRRGRGRVVECATLRSGSATFSRRRHCALTSGAGLARAVIARAAGGWGGSRDESRVGRHCHSLSGPGRAALQQPAARGRVGGRMGRGLRE